MVGRISVLLTCFSRRFRLSLIALSLLAGSLAAPHPVLGAERARDLYPVTLQLKWQHQFQFAGYYVAIDKGYYRDAGLVVNLREWKPGIDPVDEVLSGRVQFAIGDSAVLAHYLRGKPLVAVAAIFQHAPNVLVTLRDSGLTNPHDLIGKRVMYTKALGDAPFEAMFYEAGVSDDQFVRIPNTYGPALADRRRNGTPYAAYITDVTYTARQAGAEVNVLNPQSYGIDFYGDMLYTSEKTVAENPELVKKFREASLKGWRDAMNRPEEAIALIRREYAPHLEHGFLAHEAEAMQRLIVPELVEIGHISPSRLDRMAEIYQITGLVDAVPRGAARGFVYDPESSMSIWTHPAVRAGAIAVVLLLVALAAALVIGQRLKTAVRQRTADLERTSADLGHRNAILTMVDALRERFIANPDLSSLFDSVLQDVLSMTDSDFGFIGEVFTKPDGTPYLKSYALTNVAWNAATQKLYEKQRNTGMVFDSLDSLFGRAIVTGETVISNDPETDPRAAGVPKGHPRLTAFAGIPLFYGERLVGEVGLANRPDGYDPERLDRLATVFATLGQIIAARQEQRARREAEARFRSVFDNAGAFVLLGRAGKVIEANEVLCSTLGYTPSEMVEMPFPAFAHPDDVQKAETRLRDLVSGDAAMVRMGKTVSGQGRPRSLGGHHHDRLTRAG